MVARVKVTENLTLLVEGGGEIHYAGSVLADDLDHILLGSLEGSGSASLASLRPALTSFIKRYYRSQGIPWEQEKWFRERMWVGLYRSEEDLRKQQVEEEGLFSWEFREVPPTSPAVFLEKDQLGVRVVARREEKPDSTAVRRLLEPFLKRQSASCELDVGPVPEGSGRGFILTLDLYEAPRRGATLGDLWKLGDEVRALLQAAEGDELPHSAVLDLLAAGHWSLFKGQPETNWLEAKGDPYDHLEKELGENWHYELAKDVAAFANAPKGGMIILGMTTKDRGDGDIIEGHKEFDLRRVKASTYRGHVARDVYPRVEGFEVRRVLGKKKGHGLVVLVIPPQPESSRPFLVQGTIANEKALGAHVLLPVRREDETALLDAGAIHTRLRLGEQVIAGRR